MSVLLKINFIVSYFFILAIYAQDVISLPEESSKNIGPTSFLFKDSRQNEIILKTKDGWLRQSDDTVTLRWNEEPFFYLQTDVDQIELTQAWNYTLGGANALGDTISLAVIDASFYVPHEDLYQNIWTNPSEIPNDSIDNDQNGYIDDVVGLQLINENDDHDQGAISNHGTSVLGIIGAIGSNQIGVSGMCQSCKLMLLSARNDQQITQLSTIIKGFQYIIDMKKTYIQSNGQSGAFVTAVNCSWGIDYAFAKDHPIWCALLDSLGANGILTVGAVTNNEVDIDMVGDMPSQCPSDFLITVQESDEKSQLKTGTGYGEKHVDLSAPAAAYTTRWADKYGVFGGTSGAAPHVTGAIGLLSSLEIPAWNYYQKEHPAEAAKFLKSIILSSVDKNSTYDGKSVSGGELNIGRAMDRLYSFFTPVAENGILQVFPQPADQILRIQLSSVQSNEVQLTFYDLLGRPSLFATSQIVFAGQPYIEVDISSLAAGLYTLSIELGTQKFSQKVMINN